MEPLLTLPIMATAAASPLLRSPAWLSDPRESLLSYSCCWHECAGCPHVAGSNGTVLHNDGGAPMNLSGPIVLCGRSSNDTVRGYNGRLTHLALFDQAITPAGGLRYLHAGASLRTLLTAGRSFACQNQVVEPAEASRWPCDSMRIEACSVCT